MIFKRTTLSKFYHFLGSVYFALFLIAVSLLFVIFGTLLEAKFQSHLFAARFTYHHPLFIALMMLYFLNILIAALRRFPFQKKHSAFLITHLGLLMLLGGVILKAFLGLQGAIGLAEGASTKRFLILNTYALQIEDAHQKKMLSFRKNFLGPLLKNSELELTLMEWSSHSEEFLEGFIKGNALHLMGFPQIAVTDLEHLKPLQTENYVIYAARTEEPSAITFPGHRSLFFLQNEQKKETLVAFNEKGDRFETALGDNYFVFDKGFGGYGVFVELPETFPQIELIAPLSILSKSLKPHKKIEQLNPRIRLLVSEGSKSEIITLHYDRYAEGFKWPVLGGKYLLRFQPKFGFLPFCIRLKEAREIVYPQTQKPFSFESDIWVDGSLITLSMNHVFEKEGYRFYMANLVQPPFGAKRAQIIVNYDPVKYWITYPGAIVLATGIFLLYLRRNYA